MRAGLAFLALVQAVVGGWMLLAPRSFYANPWVHLHLPYNGHLLLDYGAMNLAMAVLLTIAVFRRAVVVPALWVYLVHSTLHLAIHIGFAGQLPAGQSAALVAALGVPVLLPALLLVTRRVRRTPRA
ncbi:hypothetical protein [Actinophytocola gossypii]|uniref:Integral membrane protein n=1 Tax=Actinophytocola gossypii TaxID=2812003 RepID=A0ABT2JIG4_9PSEU|nr:hypothetical protein [Actinophytocola gossypii]MCT2587668.1 hypothetical protein [Actinophytocola gossypii]